MTDRELLTLAAKAAGYDGVRPTTFDPDCWMAMVEGDWEPWNPLTEDGDALRLAVKLGLELDLLTGEKRATTAFYETSGGGAWKVHEPHSRDPYSATRRAIVRAAAAKGADHA